MKKRSTLQLEMIVVNHCPRYTCTHTKITERMLELVYKITINPFPHIDAF